MKKLLLLMIVSLSSLPVYSLEFKLPFDCKIKPDVATCWLQNKLSTPIRCAYIFVLKTENGKTKTKNSVTEINPQKWLKSMLTPPNPEYDPVASASAEATCETFKKEDPAPTPPQDRRVPDWMRRADE